MKLMALQETHVFINERNNVTIKQICWPDDNMTVELAGDQVELVMLELQRLLKENKFSIEMQEGEE